MEGFNKEEASAKILGGFQWFLLASGISRILLEMCGNFKKILEVLEASGRFSVVFEILEGLAFYWVGLVISERFSVAFKAFRHSQTDSRDLWQFQGVSVVFAYQIIVSFEKQFGGPCHFST